MVGKKKRSPRKKAGRARVQQKDDKVDSLDPWAHPMERLLTLLLSLRLQSPLMATSRLAQDPRRLVSLHHTQVALQPLLTSRIDTVLPLAPKKHKKNLLLTLPLELRVSIYQLVLNTTESDDETQSHVYEIGERRAQRSKNLALRSTASSTSDTLSLSPRPPPSLSSHWDHAPTTTPRSAKRLPRHTDAVRSITHLLETSVC
jgi:hypothetical protein